VGRSVPPSIPYAMPVALIASIFPDFDMIWFLFVDQGAIHHHRYWVHVPAFWVAALAICLPLMWWSRYWTTALLFFAVIFLHLLLDSISGGILWAAPFNDKLYALFEVPAAYSHWVLSFIFHWTFLAEIAVWVWAIFLWRKRGTP